MSDRCSLVLPYPPSLNHYWRRVGAKTLISAEGRAYREHVILLVRMAKVERLDGILGMEAVFHPPDRRRRDLDNLPKALCDALQHAGVYEDDSQFHHLDLRLGCRKPPKGEVQVKLMVLGTRGHTDGR